MKKVIIVIIVLILLGGVYLWKVKGDNSQLIESSLTDVTNNTFFEFPSEGSILKKGETYIIKWKPSPGDDFLSFITYVGAHDEQIDLLAVVSNNTGEYEWKVPLDFKYNQGLFSVKKSQNIYAEVVGQSPKFYISN